MKSLFSVVFFISEMPNESDIYVSRSVLYEIALGFLICRNKLWCIQWCQSKLFLFIFKTFNRNAIHNSLSFARSSKVCISKLGVYIFKKINNSKGVHFKHHSGQREQGFCNVLPLCPYEIKSCVAQGFKVGIRDKGPWEKSILVPDFVGSMISK